MGKLVFEVPGPEAPGYLKRQRKAAEFFSEDSLTPERFDVLIEFLLPFVKEPKDRKQAREALWDMSQNDYDELMNLVGGGSGEVPGNK